MPDSGENKVAKCGRWVVTQGMDVAWSGKDAYPFFCVHRENSEMIVERYGVREDAQLHADRMNAAETALRERRLADAYDASKEHGL